MFLVLCRPRVALFLRDSLRFLLLSTVESKGKSLMFYFFEFMQVEGINYSQRVPSEMLTELQAEPSEM